MSRVGQVPIVVPDGVSVEISGQLVTTKGKQGELSRTLMRRPGTGQRPGRTGNVCIGSLY